MKTLTILCLIFCLIGCGEKEPEPKSAQCQRLFDEYILHTRNAENAFEALKQTKLSQPSKEFLTTFYGLELQKASSAWDIWFKTCS